MCALFGLLTSRNVRVLVQWYLTFHSTSVRDTRKRGVMDKGEQVKGIETEKKDKRNAVGEKEEED